MKYIEFGSEKKKVSVIGVGCMRIADMTADEIDVFVKSAMESGINFFDHADIYAGGKSEEVFGTVLAAEPSLRDKMFLQSKVGINSGMYDFSRERILTQVEKSLANLRTDHLDSLLLHRPDVLMDPDEVMEAFRILHDSGKVLDFGVSNMNPYQMQLLKTGVTYPIAADQMQLSIAHCPMIDAGFNVNTMNDGAAMRDGGTLEYCRMNDTAIQAWSPLQQGFFGGCFLGSKDYPELNALLDKIAAEKGVSPDTVAYAWILRLPGKLQVITGTTKPARIASAAAAGDVEITRREWYDLYLAAGKTLP